ncbi:molybdopterin binding oxidoreductase [Ophiobolus disseminans]|uniref:Molybdopterin binding oxidoreductase n=1 Tax=Ophiobolus disseminans TaxID=1469910 RepID=A0A6A7AC83_9PLEO|nr:molybdopterin binding oxidoreductase [Ophiobolus disseminans]
MSPTVLEHPSQSDPTPTNPVPPSGQERNSFIRLSPPGFQIRHPPPPHELSSPITPDGSLFQITHMGIPLVPTSHYQLVIDGLVPHPYAVTLAQLKQLPSTSVTAFHECYGSPLKPSTEACLRVGNVTWTGVRLSFLLDLAGYAPSDEEQFVWSEGLDRGEFAGVQADRYQKDLPMEKALRDEVLVAYKMNDEMLSRERGAPVKLVVPGYFGTNSTKWLCRLSVQGMRAPGPYTTAFYNEVDPRDSERKRMRPVWGVEINSMITRPRHEDVVTGSHVLVQGWAWSDDGVESVHVSCDHGERWSEARVQERFQYGWQKFEIMLRLENGCHAIAARATSQGGDVQPLKGRRNHVHEIGVEVRAT